MACAIAVGAVIGIVGGCSGDDNKPGSISKYVVNGRDVAIPDAWKNSDGKLLIRCGDLGVEDEYYIAIGGTTETSAYSRKDFDSAPARIRIIRDSKDQWFVSTLYTGPIEFSLGSMDNHADLRKDGNKYQFSGVGGDTTVKHDPATPFEFEVTCPT
jgi:hypothetical protein